MEHPVHVNVWLVVHTPTLVFLWSSQFPPTKVFSFHTFQLGNIIQKLTTKKPGVLFSLINPKEGFWGKSSVNICMRKWYFVLEVNLLEWCVIISRKRWRCYSMNRGFVLRICKCNIFRDIDELNVTQCFIESSLHVLLFFHNWMKYG